MSKGQSAKRWQVAACTVVMLTGCPVGSPGGPSVGALRSPSLVTSSAGSVILTLVPEFRAGSIRILAIDRPFTAADIDHLDIMVFEVRDVQGMMLPLHDSADMIKDVSGADLGNPITFTGLKSGASYEVIAYAYSAVSGPIWGTKISDDAGTRLDLVVPNGSNQLSKVLPIQFIDRFVLASSQSIVVPAPTTFSTSSAAPSDDPSPAPSDPPPIGIDNPLTLDTPLLEHDQFLAVVSRALQLQDKAAMKDTWMSVWDVLSRGSELTTRVSADLTAMRRLVESGSISFVRDSASLARLSPSVLATYQSFGDVVTLSDNWTSADPSDKEVLVHEMKHAVDDFRHFGREDRPSERSIEGGLASPTTYLDPFSGLKLQVAFGADVNDPARTVDIEFSAFLTELQYALAQAGIDPVDARYQKDLDLLASTLDRAGLFQGSDGQDDSGVMSSLMYMLAHYYNFKPGVFSFHLWNQSWTLQKPDQNLSQMVERLYSTLPGEQGRSFLGGGRASVNAAPAMPNFSVQAKEGTDLTAVAVAQLKKRLR